MSKMFVLEVPVDAPNHRPETLTTALTTALESVQGAGLSNPLVGHAEVTLPNGRWFIASSPRFNAPTIGLSDIRRELESALTRLGIAHTDDTHAMLDDMALDLAFDLEVIQAALVKLPPRNLAGDEER